MNIQAQGAAKFLYKSDRAGVAFFDAGDAAPVALPGEDALEVGAEQRISSNHMPNYGRVVALTV